MAFRFCDSFDHYVTAQILRKWTVGPFTSINTGSGRGGGGAMVIGSGGNVSKTLDHQLEWIQGTAFTFNTDPGTAALLFTANNTQLLTLVQMNPDHTFSVIAGNNGIVATSEFSLSTAFGVYNYIEMHTTLSGSSPIMADIIIRINGETIISATGKSTGVNASSLLSGTGKANVVGMGAATNEFCSISYDDFYACDGQVDGFGHNDFQGDVRIEFVVPNGDITTDFSTHGGAGSSFSCVNENPPDDDTSYIFDGTIADTDEFNWQDISSFLGTVIAVQYSCYARKDDEGSKSFKQTMGAATFGTEFFLCDFYVYYINALDSNGGSPWTVSNFNSQTFGLTVES